MTDLPFIALPAPTNVPRAGSGSGPRSQVRTPGRARQGQRLGGRFTRLSQRLATPQGMAELRNDPGSIAPERAVVFDIADLPDVKKVYRAFEKLGFELMDEEETAAVDADFPMQPNAGNIAERLPVPGVTSTRAFEDMDAAECCHSAARLSGLAQAVQLLDERADIAGEALDHGLHERFGLQTGEVQMMAGFDT